MSKAAAPRRVEETEAMAVGRVIRSSARKLNLVAQLIRGKRVAAAITLLSFEKRRVAVLVKKVLMSAVANAENNHNLDIDQLIVSRATVGRTFVMKRFSPRARGRSASIEKPFSQITVVVKEEKAEAKTRRAGGRSVRGRQAKAPATADKQEGV